MATSLTGYSPFYASFGTNIYNSITVQQALKCIADEIKKLKPRHVRYTDNDPVMVFDDIQAVLNDPNPYMTTNEFLEKITYILLMNYNAFIIPTYYTWVDDKTGATQRKYESLYPINPQSTEFIEDIDTGEMFVKFMFFNGYETTIPLDDVIHLKYNYSVNDYMGGNAIGQPDTAAILDTLEMNYQLQHGIEKALKSSYAVNAVVKYQTLMDKGETAKALAELEEKLRNNESGFLPLDLKAEFIPLEHKSAIVDEKVLEFIDDLILRNWGVPREILKGNFSQEVYNSFYQKCLEPLVISFSEAFTKGIFTRRERAFGNKIEFYPKELLFMTVGQTIEMINTLAPTGALYENEKRRFVGLPPIKELEGERFMSLNWVNAKNADQYQLNNVNVDVVDENKTVEG